MSSHRSDSESEERDDPLAWIQRSRRLEREKKRSSRNKPTRKTSTPQTTSATYTKDQLAGLKVGHAVKEFAVGDERILTLQDTSVLEETEDQLVDVHLEEQNKTQENLDNRKRKAGYTGFDDEEFSGVIGKKRTILSQYDDVLHDKKPRETFIIPTASDQNQPGDQVKSSALANETDDGNLPTSTVKLDYKKGKAVQDYYTPAEVETLFRKPTKTKRRKAKSLRKKSSREEETPPSPTVVETDTEAVGEDMEVISRAAAHLPSVRFEETNFVDDDELQYALARTRRLRARKQTRPVVSDVDHIATLASQTRSATSMKDENIPSDTDEGGLVISETADFVSQLTPHVASQDDIPPNPPVPITGTTPPSDALPSLSQEPPGSLALPKSPVAQESLDMPTGEKPELLTDATHPLDTEEPLVSDGLAATLALLNQKGLVKQLTEEDKSRERQYQERQRWIAEERRKDQQRLKKEGSGTRSSRHRDLDTVNRDREFAREQQERMRNYRPDVRLEYTDEYGQILSTKEAFKHMSHKFHGNQSGKNKTEKRLRKLEQERKILATGNDDTPLHLSSLLQQQQESTNSAYVVLSTGNKLGVNNINLNPQLKK